MCGISCVVSLRGTSQRANRYSAKRLSEAYSLERSRMSEAMERSLETIKHRGPDDRGYWFSKHNRVVLGHVRLSIVDVGPEARQPFHDDEDQIHAVINGEFYDYETIRTDLIRKGHSFTSQCDSEILIALYKEYGMSMMEHLRGEFSFCLYDSKNEYLIAARDRYGVKPLFYTVHDGKLLIASEMKAFLAFGWEPEWDVQAVLESGYISDTRTLFQGVQRIQAGHYLSVQSFGNITQQNYWDIDYPDKYEVETRTEEEMIEGVRERLLDAVRVRLRADVPVGIFLSGGLDSSAIAGMVKHLMVNEHVLLGNSKSNLINCYSIKFMDGEFDEEPIAQRTSEWLGVKKHVVTIAEEEFVKHYSDAAWFCEVPVLDLNFIGKFALSKLTRETGVKVILSGEGSDEQFAGYGNLLADFLREMDYAWPKRDLPEDYRIQRLAEEERPNSNQDSLSNIRQPDPPSAAFARKQVNNVGMINISAFMHINGQLADWPRKEFGYADPRTVVVHNSLTGTVRSKINTKWHPLHSALYVWQKIYLANILLTTLGDRVEMSHSIEGRQPYLDHHLTEYVNKLPPTMKLRWDPTTKTFNEKWILKEAAKPFITEELYKRRKHPFSAPVKYQKDGPLQRYFESIMTRENVENIGFLEWNKCKGLIREAFVEKNSVQMRKLFLVTQFIEIGKRFGVKKAVPEYTI